VLKGRTIRKTAQLVFILAFFQKKVCFIISTTSKHSFVKIYCNKRDRLVLLNNTKVAASLQSWLLTPAGLFSRNIREVNPVYNKIFYKLNAKSNIKWFRKLKRQYFSSFNCQMAESIRLILKSERLQLDDRIFSYGRSGICYSTRNPYIICGPRTEYRRICGRHETAQCENVVG